MKNTVIILALVLFFACSDKTQQATGTGTDKKEETASGKSGQTNGAFKRTLSDGTLDFHVSADNGERTTILVRVDGLEQRDFQHTYEVEGQLKEAYLLDLNKDGFSELYLVVAQTGDAGNLEIKGLASYKNKGAGEIFARDVQAVRRVNTDRVYEKDGQLMRTFVNENGETVTIAYELTKGETSYILEPRLR